MGQAMAIEFKYVLPPVGMSDAFYIELFHGQTTTAYPPEEICRELRVYSTRVWYRTNCHKGRLAS